VAVVSTAPPSQTDLNKRFQSMSMAVFALAGTQVSRALCLVLAGCTACGSGLAAPEPADTRTPEAAAAAAAPADASPPQPLIESARAQARSVSEQVARRVDGWFGDIPFEGGGRVTQGRLSLGVFHRRDQGSDVDVRFTARWRLPNLEKSAYLFFGRDDPRDLVKDTPRALNSKQQLLAGRPEDRSFLGGLGLSRGDEFSARLGFSAHLEPFAQARYDKLWALAPDRILGFRETLFWSRGDRFGSTTALSYDLRLRPLWAMRWIGAATVTQETRNLEWSSTLGGYRAFGGQRRLALELLFSGTGTRGTGVGMSDRGLLAKWEQPLYRDWLLGQLVAGHFWPRPSALEPRGRAFAIGANLNMNF
jgi:hypothetical protein